MPCIAEAKAAEEGLDSIVVHEDVLPAMFINIRLKLEELQYVYICIPNFNNSLLL